jgi:hypothetical protein
MNGDDAVFSFCGQLTAMAAVVAWSVGGRLVFSGTNKLF